MIVQKRSLLLASVAVFAPIWLLATSPASADQVGTLTCNVSPGVGLVITSTKALACQFTRQYGPPEYYTGSISNFGVALGATGPGRLVWGVFAATNEPGRYALAGHYGGASANVSLGPGLGANALVGGNGQSIGLQPLSVNAQSGVDVTAGITDLTLVPAPRYHHFHHYHHYYHNY